MSAFTSLEAHNGCRALFNRTAGWAYIGPAGSIKAADFPGTVSYEYRNRGSAGGVSAAGVPQRGGKGTSTRPGDGLHRKTDDVRSAYLDATDLEHLVQEAGRFGYFPPSAVSTVVRADIDAGDARRVPAMTAEQQQHHQQQRYQHQQQLHQRPAQSRRGRPIVLTLQAILAATSPPTSGSAAAGDASGDASTRGEVEHGAAPVAASDKARVNDDDGHKASVPPASDHAQFPPLVLREVSAEKEGLFLAPPITMVKQQSERPARSADMATTTAGTGEELGNDHGHGGVSCSEAVAATSVAAAAAAAVAANGGPGLEGSGEGGVGAVSRVGWWLQWATSTADSDSEGSDPTLDDNDTTTSAAPSAAPPTPVSSPIDVSTMDIARDEEGEEEDGEAFSETRDGMDGWQVVSTGEATPLEVYPHARTTATTGAPSATEAAKTMAAAAAGAARALVTGGWRSSAENASTDAIVVPGMVRGREDSDAASWCDCASDMDAEIGSSEEGVDSGIDAAMDGSGTVASLAACDLVPDSGVDSDASDAAVMAAVTIELALEKAVNGTVYDSDGSLHGVDGVGFHLEQQRGSVPHSLAAAMQDAMCVPPAMEFGHRSFRDTLMTPRPSGRTTFVSSPALRSRRGQNATASRHLSVPGPKLVDVAGAGGAVYLWREAAAGKADRVTSDGWEDESEDEDPYYARKRVGAFAFRTKPRGKAHK